MAGVDNRPTLLCLAGVVLLSILQAGTGAAQERDWQAWVRLVNTHLPGQADDALREAATWPREKTLAAIGELHRSGLTDLPRVASLGVMLHTDIAIQFRAPDGYRLPTGTDPMTVVADGQAVGSASRTYHWDVCRRLIERS